MATYPLRNRVLALANPTTYWASDTAPGGEIPDLLHPGDSSYSMYYDQSTTAYNPSNSWKEKGRLMSGTNNAWADMMDKRQVFENGQAYMVQLAVQGASVFSGGVATQDLLTFEPNAASGSSDQAFVLTAVHDEATKELTLHAQVYDSGAWTTYQSFNLGKLQPFAYLDVYVMAFQDPESGSLVVVGASGGAPLMSLTYLSPAGGAALRVSQIRSVSFLAGNRPDIGAPPITGNGMTVGFCWAANLPAPLRETDFWDVCSVDQAGFTKDPSVLLWPYDNSEAELLAPVSAGVPFAVLSVDPAEARKFRAPGPSEKGVLTLVDPATGANERCLLWNMDILAGQITVLRGPFAFNDPTPAWAAGTLAKGLLTSAMAGPMVTINDVLPGKYGDPILGAESVKIYRHADTLNFSGDTWSIRFPNGRALIVEEVLVEVGSGIGAGATIEVGTPADPDAILAATALPTLADSGAIHAIPISGTRIGANEIRINVTGGSGFNFVMLKGAFKPF